MRPPSAAKGIALTRAAKPSPGRGAAARKPVKTAGQQATPKAARAPAARPRLHPAQAAPQAAPPEHEVGRQLSFALYSAANRMVRLHKPLLEPLGLTFPQFLVMLELHAGTPRAVGEIGARLDMDTGTITPVLKRLEAAGHLKRRRDPSDERRVLITLTRSGEALRQPLFAVTGQIRCDCRLDEADLTTLRETLEALAWPEPEHEPPNQPPARAKRPAR